MLARACPLEQLSLCGITNVSNRGVKEVAEEAGESLIAIDLGESDVSNGAVTKGLSGRCPKLCRLRLFACSRITDLALVSAATGLPSLEKIDLEGCDQCTQAGLAALRTGRPLIEILPPLNMGGVVV